MKGEPILAGFLRYGVLAACVWIAAGLVLTALHGEPSPVLSGGILLLILLPVGRVALTMMMFILNKDYRFAAISGLVLLIIVAGFIVGVTHRDFSSP